MNTRTILLVIVAVAVGTLTACNWTVGDCYPREERSSGVGAGPGWDPTPVFSSSASGDFADAPQDGKEHKIQCNKTDSDDESQSDSSERPTDSPTIPQDPCPGVGDIAGDGATFFSCSDACSSKCPPPGMASFTYVDFDLSDFPFVTTVEDDGQGDAGGYQVAMANLKFTHAVIQPSGRSTTEWYCALTIQMPLRTQFMGRIDPIRAASLSEEITEDVANRMDYKLPQGIFCNRFRLGVEAKFKLRYPLLGASVKN
jgi:hypothetical protein